LRAGQRWEEAREREDEGRKREREVGHNGKLQKRVPSIFHQLTLCIKAIFTVNGKTQPDWDASHTLMG